MIHALIVGAQVYALLCGSCTVVMIGIVLGSWCARSFPQKRSQ